MKELKKMTVKQWLNIEKYLESLILAPIYQCQRSSAANLMAKFLSGHIDLSQKKVLKYFHFSIETSNTIYYCET